MRFVERMKEELRRWINGEEYLRLERLVQNQRDELDRRLQTIDNLYARIKHLEGVGPTAREIVYQMLAEANFRYQVIALHDLTRVHVSGSRRSRPSPPEECVTFEFYPDGRFKDLRGGDE